MARSYALFLLELYKPFLNSVSQNVDAIAFSDGGINGPSGQLKTSLEAEAISLIATVSSTCAPNDLRIRNKVTLDPCLNYFRSPIW
jgi:hypothetical protein